MQTVSKGAALSSQEQLDDLRRRFALLEAERMASFETASLSIEQNEEIIQQMLAESGSMKKKIAKLRNEKPEIMEQQFDKAMSEEQAMQRKLDGMRAQNKKKSASLEALGSRLHQLSVSSEIPSSEASPEMRQIRVLENRVDKAMIKHSEAQSIRKTYEAIVNQLQKERSGFDSRLIAIEDTLKAKERDYEEVLLLSHDAYQAKEVAQAELHCFEQGIMTERCRRHRQVQEQNALVEQRVAMNRRLESHCKQIQERSESKDVIGATDLTPANSSIIGQGTHQKLEEYEAVFHVLQEATGTNDINDIIRKFHAQEDMRKNLVKFMEEDQATIDKLTEERRKIQFQVAELKFSASGSASRRQAIDEKETRLAQATDTCERNKSKFERSAKMLIDAKAGIEHLSQKLASIKLQSTCNLDTDGLTVEDLLESCELKISKLLDLTHHCEEERRFDDDEMYQGKLLNGNSGARYQVMNDDTDHEEDDYDEDDIGEDIVQRKQVKYNSDQILLQQQIRMGARRRIPDER